MTQNQALGICCEVLTTERKTVMLSFRSRKSPKACVLKAWSPAPGGYLEGVETLGGGASWKEVK